MLVAPYLQKFVDCTCSGGEWEYGKEGEEIEMKSNIHNSVGSKASEKGADHTFVM